MWWHLSHLVPIYCIKFSTKTVQKLLKEENPIFPFFLNFSNVLAVIGKGFPSFTSSFLMFKVLIDTWVIMVVLFSSFFLQLPALLIFLNNCVIM